MHVYITLHPSLCPRTAPPPHCTAPALRLELSSVAIYAPPLPPLPSSTPHAYYGYRANFTLDTNTLYIT